MKKKDDETVLGIGIYRKSNGRCCSKRRRTGPGSKIPMKSGNRT